MSTIDNELLILEETKQQIKQALINKEQEVLDTDSFRSYADKINDIQVGVDTSDANAVAEDLVLGKTAYVNGEKITGTIRPIYGDETSGGFSYVSPPPSYMPDGLRIGIFAWEDTLVKLNQRLYADVPGKDIAYWAGLTPEKLVSGNTVLGVVGTGGSSNGGEGLKTFVSVESMNTSTDNNLYDIAAVGQGYASSGIGLWTPHYKFYFPLTVQMWYEPFEEDIVNVQYKILDGSESNEIGYILLTNNTVTISIEGDTSYYTVYNKDVSSDVGISGSWTRTECKKVINDATSNITDEEEFIFVDGISIHQPDDYTSGYAVVDNFIKERKLIYDNFNYWDGRNWLLLAENTANMNFIDAGSMSNYYVDLDGMDQNIKAELIDTNGMEEDGPDSLALSYVGAYQDMIIRIGGTLNLCIQYPQLAELIGLTPDKIKAGETILGITGTYEGDVPEQELQEQEEILNTQTTELNEIDEMLNNI